MLEGGFMQIITYLITGIILALSNYFLFKKNKKTLAIVNDLLFLSYHLI